MKESKIIELKNKIERIVPMIYQEMQSLKDLAIGTLETVKRIPGYEQALESLKTDISKKTNDKETEKDPISHFYKNK